MSVRQPNRSAWHQVPYMYSHPMTHSPHGGHIHPRAKPIGCERLALTESPPVRRVEMYSDTDILQFWSPIAGVTMTLRLASSRRVVDLEQVSVYSRGLGHGDEMKYSLVQKV